MRFWPFIASAYLLVMVSCRKSVEYETLANRRPEFASVQGLIDVHPDSAFRVFNSLADTLNEEALHRKSPFQYAEYQLLKTEIRCKNHFPVQNDEAMQEAFAFYDSILPGVDYSRKNKALSFQKARAYYCKAVVEENKTDQHVEAFSDYLNALWMMDGLSEEYRVISFSKPNLDYEHLKALIYDRLAWFFYTYDAWDVAMECLEKSIQCFDKENNQQGIAANFELMGDIKLAQDDRFGAMAYYKRSDSIHERLKTNDLHQHYSSLIHRSIDLYNAGEPKASYNLLHHALELAEDDRLRRQVRLSLGYFYYEIQQYDSALYNYERSFPLLPRQTIKSYCRIVKTANILGDSLKAAYYGELLSDIYLAQMAKSDDKTQMIMLFEDYKARCKELKQKDLFFFVLMSVVVLLVILVVDSIVISKRKRRHLRDIAAHEKLKTLLEDEISSTKKASSRKEEKIRSLELELEKAISSPDFQKLPFDKKMDTLFEMPICKRVCMVKDANVKAGASYPELVLSESQMTKLVNAVDALFPKFSVKIIERYPRLKRFDVVYCCMYVLGITEVQAAALTGKTYQAVWTRSLKLHEVFADKSHLQLFLQDLLKNW